MTNSHTLSNLDRSTSHSISSALVKQTECKSTPPTQDGSRSSDMITRQVQLSTGKMIEYSTSKTTRTKKETPFKYKKTPTQPTRNGRSSMLTKLPRQKLMEPMKNSVSASTDHST